MGWDIVPACLDTLIRRVRAQYTDLPIYITENGSAWEDEVENVRCMTKSGWITCWSIWR
jgi:beta-glucosidase